MMKFLFLLTISLAGLFSNTAYPYQLSTNLFTKHLISDTYFDKKQKKDVKYNENNKMFMVWDDLPFLQSILEASSSTKYHYGFGRFTNSFYESGFIGGFVVEPRLSIMKYDERVIGDLYYGFGSVMTNTYRKMAYKPIPIFHIGFRNQDWFFNVGGFGAMRVITGNIGFNFK